MGKSSILLFLTLVGLLAIYVVVLRLAAERVIKSKLSDGEKVYWIISFVIFNLAAGIVFVIYHDYFLNSARRSN